MIEVTTTHGLSLDKSGRRLAVVGPGAGAIFDTLSGQCLTSLIGPIGHAYDVDFAPDGQSVAVCFHGGHVRRYDASTGEICTIYEGHQGVPHGVRKVSFHPEGKLLASVAEDSTLRLWHVQDATQHMLFTARADVNTVAWGPSEDHIIFGSDVGLHLVNIQTRTGRSLDTSAIAEVFVQNDLIYAGWGESIRILDTQLNILSELPQSHIARLRLHEQTLFAASWKGPDQGIVAWHLPTSTRLARLPFDGYHPQVWAMALDPIRERIYAGFTPTDTTKSGVKCWSTSTFEPMCSQG